MFSVKLKPNVPPNPNEKPTKSRPGWLYIKTWINEQKKVSIYSWNRPEWVVLGLRNHQRFVNWNAISPLPHCETACATKALIGSSCLHTYYALLGPLICTKFCLCSFDFMSDFEICLVTITENLFILFLKYCLQENLFHTKISNNATAFAWIIFAWIDKLREGNII